MFITNSVIIALKANKFNSKCDDRVNQQREEMALCC